MYKICKTEKSKQRQKLIEKKFLKLLKNKHYEDITVSELCLLANVPRKAFYRYFETKEDVLNALLDHSLQEYEAYSAVNKSGQRILKVELTDYFNFWTTDHMKELLKALKKSNLVSNIYYHSKNMVESGFVNTNRFLPEESSWRQKQIFNFAIMGLVSIMLDWFDGGCVQSSEEMASIATRMLTTPLFPKLEELGIEKE